MLTPENAFWRAKQAKNGPKTPFQPHLDALPRNSLRILALVREILYSHSLRIRAILVNLSQKIAKPQANASAPNGPSQTNI
jgi:hypothetical protein